jgi:hypothetical protein
MSKGMNSCRCRLSFVAAKEVGAVHKPALELFVALGHALSSVQKLRVKLVLCSSQSWSV